MKNNEISDLIKKSNMTKTEFANFLNIPIRTIDNWTTSSKNKRTCAPYIIELIEYKLKKEGKIKED